MLSAIGVVLIIFMLMSFFAFRIYTEKRDTEESSLAESQCLRIASIISGIYTSGQGSVFNLSTEYNTTFDDGRLIIVDTGRREAACRSFADFTNGTSDTFIAERSSLLFSNSGGKIIISAGKQQ